MKTFSKTFILILALNAMVWLAPQKASAQVSVNFQIFYDNLSPYGDWVFNSDYGYVWVPDVSYEFTPYSTNGYWTFTNVGWTWVSNYSWGWAPFHYGRWSHDNYYGWFWVPGDEWGPGWVSWRRSSGYYGWAPIGPGISITFAYSSGYRLPYNQWTFVRDRDFGRTNINNYYVNSSSNITIINNSTVINNVQIDNSSRVRYNTGPSKTEVQRRTGKSIAPVMLRERNNPGQNLGSGELQIYRPRVEKNNTGVQRPEPYNVVRKEDVMSVNQRNANTQSRRGNQQNNSQQHKQQQEQQRNAQQERNNQQAQQQQEQQRNTQQERNNQQAQQQQEQQQRNNQQAQQQQQQQQRNNQQSQQQQEQQQRKNQQAQQQQEQQERNNQQAKQQQEQQQKNNQQAQQQQEQQERNNQQAKQQQEQQQKNNQQAQKEQTKKEQTKKEQDKKKKKNN
jgi:hypothetical protein